MTHLTYSIITPVRDESEHLPRLIEAVSSQTLRPTLWVIVDTGSTDETLAVADGLAATRSWVTVRRHTFDGGPTRGAPIVAAFHAGVRALPHDCDIVVKADADVSMGAEFFEQLLERFEEDDRLGIAGGMGYELTRRGTWRQRHGTGAAVWGACRAYRRTCLDEILPLEERMGWDTLDLVAAQMRGWKTELYPDLPFLHHRAEAVRDSSRFVRWSNQGRAAYYMGYRPSYLILRSLYRALRDPMALGIAYGFLRAATRPEPRADSEVRAYVARQQRLRELPARIREALAKRRELGQHANAL